MATLSECTDRMSVSLPSFKISGRALNQASVSDELLILAARSGSESAFSHLCERHSGRVYRTILRITKNPEDAEDAMQDSLLRAFLALDSFEGRSSFYSWLTRIAINSALGILRKRRRRLEISLDSPSQQNEDVVPEELKDLAPSQEEVFGQHQRQARLMQAIRRLPTDQREAILARMAGDWSVKTVAYQLNISEAAAKSRLYRASTRLCSLIAIYE